MERVCLLFTFLQICRISVGLPGCCISSYTNDGLSVSCYRCGLTAVPLDLPKDTVDLEFAYNNLNVLDADAFSYLGRLQSLSLRCNGLWKINAGAFRGLYSLRGLYLNDNNLTHRLDEHIFSSLVNLEVLHIQSNSFHRDKLYPDKVWKHLNSLQTLYIDIFEDFRFGKGFLELSNLRNMYIFQTNNRDRVSIQNSSFQVLAKSDISYLNIYGRLKMLDLDALSPFHRLRSLTIDSDFSLELRDILPSLYGLRNRTMDSIVLNHNYIPFSNGHVLQNNDIKYLQSICVNKLDLQDNRILRINLDVISSWTTKTCLQVLDISINKFLSSNTLILVMTLLPALTHLDATFEIYLEKRKRRDGNGIHLIEKIFIPKSLIYINISHNQFRMKDWTFPEGSNLQILDVSFLSRHSRPSTCRKLKGLVHMTEMYISGLDCSEPNPQMFADMPRLSRLEARNCNFRDSTTSTLFRGLRSLSYIDLSGNQLSHPNSSIFVDQRDSLKTLIVNNNGLDNFPVDLLQPLNLLQLLDFRHNKLSELTDAEYSSVDNLRKKSEKFKIKLFGNPLLCNCRRVKFLGWIMTTEAVLDKDMLECVTTDGNSVKLVHFLESFEDFQVACVSQFWVTVSIILIILFVLFGTVSIVAWRNSVRLRIWFRKPNKDDIRYDAFISYSHKDSSWIGKFLKPALENEAIKFCCYDKDFDAGENIVDNVMDAIDYSRKVVFIVTHNFIHSEWATYEIGIASMYAFRDGRENMNIVVLLEDIQRSEMPRVLRRLWDTVVCLKWPSEDNANCTDQRDIVEERKQFWRQFAKCILKGNRRAPANTAESAV